MPFVIERKDMWANIINRRGIVVLTVAETESEPAVCTTNVTGHGVR